MKCRLCASTLTDIVDFGEQCLGGQFPQREAPDPPRFPLVLSHCADGCGLVQLKDTVDDKLMFTDYWYRSGVTETMRGHLAELAGDAIVGLRGIPQRVLDIGANDGTLLRCFDGVDRWGIDPSDLPMSKGETRIKGFYPHHALEGQKFDLIFTIACFYDVDDPVGFARAVYDNLKDDGLWVVEVADLGMVLGGNYDAICHEHLTYWDVGTFWQCVQAANLHLVKWERNKSNGGSLRFYVSKLYERLEPPEEVVVDAEAFRNVVYLSRKELRHLLGRLHDEFWQCVQAANLHLVKWERNKSNGGSLRFYVSKLYERLEPPEEVVVDAEAFRNVVYLSRKELRHLLGRLHDEEGKRIHLLGASTKANTWLQFCGFGPETIEFASDRDLRKRGTRTPGSGIPIVSEEESRMLMPDVYVVGPGHFRDEIVEREKEFLERGGKLVFPLPKLEVVG